MMVWFTIITLLDSSVYLCQILLSGVPVRLMYDGLLNLEKALASVILES